MSFLKKAFSGNSSSAKGDGKVGKEKEGSSANKPSSVNTASSFPVQVDSPVSGRQTSSLYTVPILEDGVLSPNSMPSMSNGRAAVPNGKGGGGGQERVVSVLQEQVAALVAKVGRLEKGMGRVPPSPAAASRGAAGQELESEGTGPGLFLQLQKQVKALERQQQELQAVSSHTPTHEQLVALQRQVEELQQQKPAVQAQGEAAGQAGANSDMQKQLVALQQQVEQLRQQKPAAVQGKGETSLPGGSSDGTQTQQLLAELVQRMDAAEESLAQMRGMTSSKSPEGLVPRGEMMRAFSLLHDALGPKVKKILEEEGAHRQAGGAIDSNEFERQITLIQEQGKREVEGLRREIEAFKISTSHAIAQQASRTQDHSRRNSFESDTGRSPKSGHAEKEGKKSVLGELAKSWGPQSHHSPKMAVTPVKPDGADACAEVDACKEMTAALDTELGLMRQLIDGMNNNFMRRMDTMDDQLLELYDKAGTLTGQISAPRETQGGVASARREKQMADNILENLMAEVGPGLETSLHDAEHALQIAGETRADLDQVRGVVGKMGKKVDELSSGLVMVTGKLNSRLSKIEIAESERGSLAGGSVAGESRRGSDSGETSMSASSRSLLEKWRKTAAGSQSSRDLRERPQTCPGKGGDNSEGMGRSGSGNLFNQDYEKTPPRAKRASSAFRADGFHNELETVLSGEQAVYSHPPSSNGRAWDAKAGSRLAKESQQYSAHLQAQALQRVQEKKLEAQQRDDAERVAAQREWTSARRSNSGGRDSYSVASTDPDSPMPSAFKPERSSGEQEQGRQPLRRTALGCSSSDALPPRGRSGRIRVSEDGYSVSSLPIKSGRIRASDDGNSAASVPQKASHQRNTRAGDEDGEPLDPLSSDLLRPSSAGGSVFRLSSSGGNSPVHSSKLARPASMRGRGAPATIHKEGPPTAKLRSTAQIEQEKRDLLRKL